MSPFLQFNRSSTRLLRSRLAAAALMLVCGMAAVACGEVTCPDPLSNVDGVCQKVDRFSNEEPGPAPAAEPTELCDGADNDGDELIDEDWPELGTTCGQAGVGDCVEGVYACATDALGVVCEGGQGPVSEVCDGRDNDCDGLIDEGVLSMKQEHFADHATVSALDHGFVVTRLLADQVRVETYDEQGVRTGHHDDIDNPSADNAFLDSDAFGKRVLVAVGQYRFHVLEAQVDSDRVPVITGTQQLHSDWDQGLSGGVYKPPHHPRVVAFPPRFVGQKDFIRFASTPFATDSLDDLAQPLHLVEGLPFFTRFDAAASFLVWEQDDNVRAGVLLEDGSIVSSIDVGRGSAPSVASGAGGPAVAYLLDANLFVSELSAFSLQCLEGHFCNDRVDSDQLGGASVVALAFDEARDTWVVVAGEQLLLVGRGAAGPVLKQSQASRVGEDGPSRIDVAVSAGTAAIVQSTASGESALTFLGCF